MLNDGARKTKSKLLLLLLLYWPDVVVVVVVLQFAGHVDVIQDIKFLGLNDSHIAVATNSQLIKIFEVNTWACQILSGHSDFVISLDVYQKNELNLLISGSKVRDC